MILIEKEVLERIEYFLKLKHWTLYKLAKKSGLPYSSLSNIFNRKTCPTIPTLEKICTGFGISLSDFFAFQSNPLKSEDLTDREQDLLYLYQSLSLKDKDLAIAFLNGLNKSVKI